MFLAEKHPTMKSKVESSSPVKITNYLIRKNKFTDEDEVHINERTKLEDPSRNEILLLNARFRKKKNRIQQKTVSTT